MTPEPVAVAYHESGHAVAAILAFRDAKWLPKPPPSVRVRSVAGLPSPRLAGSTALAMIERGASQRLVDQVQHLDDLRDAG
jgi:hypothetical protein